MIAAIIAGFGPARITGTTPSADGLLISRREILAAEIRLARKNHRPVKALHRQAFSATHEILRRGVV